MSTDRNNSRIVKIWRTAAYKEPPRDVDEFLSFFWTTFYTTGVILCIGVVAITLAILEHFATAHTTINDSMFYEMFVYYTSTGLEVLSILTVGMFAMIVLKTAVGAAIISFNS